MAAKQPPKNVKVLAILRLLTNEEIQKVIGKEMDLRELHDYYKVPVMCLLRIKESVDTWEKQAGSNGYFEFIEQYMGAEIKGKEMNFSVLATK